MRILNEDNGQPVSNVLLMLTPEEAKEPRDDLTHSLRIKHKIFHAHVDDIEYQHEITFAIYSDDNLDTFHERIQRLILDDT